MCIRLESTGVILANLDWQLLHRRRRRFRADGGPRLGLFERDLRSVDVLGHNALIALATKLREHLRAAPRRGLREGGLGVAVVVQIHSAAGLVQIADHAARLLELGVGLIRKRRTDVPRHRQPLVDGCLLKGGACGVCRVSIRHLVEARELLEVNSERREGVGEDGDRAADAHKEAGAQIVRPRGL